MERKKKKEGSGFYIAICCCMVIIAIVGYASRMSMGPEEPQNELAKATNEPIITATKKPELPAVTAKPAVTQEPKEATSEVNKSVEAEEASFVSPVSGNVIEEYSGEDLVYNEALKDWRSHSGVDFAAKIDEQVLCSADGVVEDVFDSSLGHCVVVDHQNGYKTMYANLNENTTLAKGDKLLQGDVIGTVGDTALGDSTDAPHLHFEVMRKDENVNPIEYLE